MQTHQAKQEGRVELNIGGYRFQTSVDTLRRVPYTFFDAYFSGRYAQDVCDDGSIFVDRDGENFGHILEYMRDGVVSVAEPGAYPSVRLLRLLKREFGFYCIELCVERPVVLKRPAFVMGGVGHDNEVLSSMEGYDASSGEWSTMAAMSTARQDFAACVADGEIYIIAGYGSNETMVSSVEKYSPSSNTWCTIAPLPAGLVGHATVAVGCVIYVLGGETEDGVTASVLKFNFAESSWSEIAPMPAPRGGFASCTYMSDVYVFGGFDERGNVQASVFKLDTVANVWSIHAPMPTGCTFHSSSLVDVQIYIVGAGASGCELLRFELTSNVWSTLAPTSVSRKSNASFVLADCLYALGCSDFISSSASVERNVRCGDEYVDGSAEHARGTTQLLRGLRRS
jgi:hypothetical protein